MDVAIVILNWNGMAWLRRFLPGILTHAEGAQVIVADNGSTDGSADLLEREFPSVRTIRMARNRGFAGGYNECLSQVKAGKFVLLNSDVEVTPGWWRSLATYLDSDPRLAACQPKVLSYKDRGNFEHAGAAGGFIDRNGYPFCRGRIFELTEQDNGQYDGESEVFWATGACMMIRAEAFHAAGGFDDVLFAHMEEIDLCWRLRRMGWKIGYTSSAVVYHVGGGALGYGSPRKTFLNFRNSLIVLTKNLHTRWFPLSMFRRLVLDGFAAWKFLLEGHAGHSWQVCRAHWAYFALLPGTLRLRRRLRRSERTPDLTGMYHRSIAFDRFILGWRKFSDLDHRAFEHAGPAKPARRANNPVGQIP